MTTKTQANEKQSRFQDYLQSLKEYAYYKGIATGSNQILARITDMRDDAVQMAERAEDKMNAARVAFDAAPEAGEAAPSSSPPDSEE